MSGRGRVAQLRAEPVRVPGTLRPWHLAQVGSAEPHPLVVDAYLLGWRHGAESAAGTDVLGDLDPKRHTLEHVCHVVADVARGLATDTAHRQQLTQLLQLRAHQVMRGIVRTLGQDPHA